MMAGVTFVVLFFLFEYVRYFPIRLLLFRGIKCKETWRNFCYRAVFRLYGRLVRYVARFIDPWSQHST
jgi:hypothetical protein